ncbi:hypothetical protein DENSPDRAFT_849979 [Dentipellis sp. KUC8613]|nr:hypothetical protein DENSPDRAFT_849979 [Dentipellis sp. KUC8613]
MTVREQCSESGNVSAAVDGVSGTISTVGTLIGREWVDTFSRPKAKLGRSVAGCTTCRGRKIKCDEVKPRCSRCTRDSRECEWRTLPARGVQLETQPLMESRPVCGPSIAYEPPKEHQGLLASFDSGSCSGRAIENIATWSCGSSAARSATATTSIFGGGDGQCEADDRRRNNIGDVERASSATFIDSVVYGMRCSSRMDSATVGCRAYGEDLIGGATLSVAARAEPVVRRDEEARPVGVTYVDTRQGVVLSGLDVLTSRFNGFVYHSILLLLVRVANLWLNYCCLRSDGSRSGERVERKLECLGRVRVQSTCDDLDVSTVIQIRTSFSVAFFCFVGSYQVRAQVQRISSTIATSSWFAASTAGAVTVSSCATTGSVLAGMRLMQVMRVPGLWLNRGYKRRRRGVGVACQYQETYPIGSVKLGDCRNAIWHANILFGSAIISAFIAVRYLERGEDVEEMASSAIFLRSSCGFENNVSSGGSGVTQRRSEIDRRFLMRLLYNRKGLGGWGAFKYTG